MSRRGCRVAVVRAGPADRLVRPLVVVDALVAGDVLGERGTVVDLVQVQVLVLERLIPALDHAVGLRRAVPGADVLELRARADVAREAAGAETGAIVGDHPDRVQLSGGTVDDVLDQRMPERFLGPLAGRIKRGDLIVLEAMGGGFTWGAVLARW